MTRQIGFEWHIGEEEYESRRTDIRGELARSFLSAGERRLTHGLLRTLTAVLVVAAAAAATAFSPAQIQRIQAKEGIGLALTQEQNAWETRNWQLYNALIDPKVEDAWIGEWRDSWGVSSSVRQGYALNLMTAHPVDGDLVQAHVQVTLPKTHWWRTLAHRETRFYRSAGEGWLRTLPPAAYWGERLTLETPHLLFYFHAPDAEAVAAAAVKLERAYTGLHATLGLQPTEQAEQIVVSVKPDVVRTWTWSGGELQITSPTLTQIPYGLTDGEHLARTAMRRIIYRAVSTDGFSRTLFHWGFMLGVARSWLRADLLDQPDPWREEAMDIFRTRGAERFPLRLADVSEFDTEGRPGREQILWRHMAAESMLEYMIQRHGRDRLPALLEGFSQHRSWDELLSTVLDTTPGSFVAGWNLYLEQAYGF